MRIVIWRSFWFGAACADAPDDLFYHWVLRFWARHARRIVITALLRAGEDRGERKATTRLTNGSRNPSDRRSLRATARSRQNALGPRRERSKQSASTRRNTAMRGAAVRSLSRGLGGAHAFPRRERGVSAFGSQLPAASTGGAPAAGGGGGGWSTAALLTAGAAVGTAAGLAGARLLGGGPAPAAAGDAAPRFGALAGTPWSEALAAAPGARRVVTGAQLLAEDHPFLEDDHMFAAFVAKDIIRDIEGWYAPGAAGAGAPGRFSALVALGREVAGFPRVVHGGLTAAIFDECFGGLLFSLKGAGALHAPATRVGGPMYTVRLEVDYKAKIAAGTTVLCTVEVERMEGRKLWMVASLTDGPGGKVFATSRALFVAPKLSRFATDVAKYVWSRVRARVAGGGAEE